MMVAQDVAQPMNREGLPLAYRELPFGRVEPVYDWKDYPTNEERRVGRDLFMPCYPWWKFWHPYGAEVSTVFLAIDHAFGDGAPILWETMIFMNAPGYEDEQWRYTSRANAACGHAAICRLVRRMQWKRLAALPYMNPAGPAGGPDE